MVLGLDLSSVNSGYAIFQEDHLITYGSIIPPKTMSHSEKLSYIYEKIDELLDAHPIHHVAIEDQHMRKNVDTLKLLSRIAGVAMLCANQHECTVSLYPPTTVKHEFTGNGKAQKTDMISKAMDLYDLDRKNIDDNIADAIGVAYTHRQKVG